MDRPATSAPVAGQTWSADDYARNAGFVPVLGADVLALLDPRPGERILDLGCGDGALTLRLEEAGARVTGLEPDPDMARVARARGITVLEQDAHDPFGESTYEAVFSNAALHWMRDPGRVLANVARALRPGGRFVAEQGGFGNVAAVVTAINAAREAAGLGAVRPWDFPSPTLQRRRLEAAGLRVRSIALVPRPTPLPTGMSGWLATFAGPFLRDARQRCAGGSSATSSGGSRRFAIRRKGGSPTTSACDLPPRGPDRRRFLLLRPTVAGPCRVLARCSGSGLVGACAPSLAAPPWRHEAP